MKVTHQELKTLQHLAKEHLYKTGEKIVVEHYYEGRALMVKAPKEFLEQWGF